MAFIRPGTATVQALAVIYRLPDVLTHASLVNVADQRDKIGRVQDYRRSVKASDHKS
jgi:hypothetical protein